jgi:hypothetical protein
LNVISTVCNLYDADGLYAIDSTQHSPLIGFAYDGFPIYGAYGYKNTDGTGGITRIKSGYQLKTSRGTGTVPSTTTWALGYFREDYEFVAHATQDYLDEHNGRFCITPEYPNGTYCYFATVDANWNSAYPYVVGPTFYGVYANRKVTSVTEATTVYTPSTGVSNTNEMGLKLNIFPNPANDFIAIQVLGLNKDNLNIELYDATGKLIQHSTINAGATNTYLDASTLYSGVYMVRIASPTEVVTKQVLISK